MVKRCPNCKSDDVEIYMGGMFGKYQCNNCGYLGALIIEENDEKDASKKSRQKTKRFKQILKI
jgi:Zn ribbon nucleic-acid-binding protein